MPRKISTLIFILLFLKCSICLAQDESATWDAKHADEVYTHLLIERTVELKKDYSSIEKIHIIIRIQKEEAKSLGEIPIDYDRSFEEIKDIKAFVTTPDGKRMNYKSIQDLTPYSGEPLYSDSRTKVITMPNVIPGSIINWQATIVNKKPIIKGAFWDKFDFAFEAPVKSLAYKLIIPRGISIQILNHNTDIKPHIKESNNSLIYSWSDENLAKFEPEEYMPPYDEFYKYVIVSSIKDWSDIAVWYKDLTDKNLKISTAMKDKVSALINGKDNEAQKIQAIMEYIQDNFRYVSMSFGYHRYEPHPTEEVFNNKYGDCKDQVLVFMAMLKEAKITSYPVLYCDEDSGNPKDKLPMPAYFNHAILAIPIDGKTHYVDILQKGYLFNEVPLSLESGYVFVINDKAGYFEQLSILDESENATLKESKIIIREDGSALIETTSQWSKDYSINFRKGWKNMTDKQKAEFMESLDEAHTVGGKMLERKWENLDTEYGKIKILIKYEIPHWTAVMGEFMIFGGQDYERNTSFAKEKRIYPMVFRSNSLNKYVIIYEIPEGFEIANLPKEVHLETEFADFFRGFKINGNTITETGIRRYKHSRLPVADYSKVKDFYNKLSQLTKEKIIIKRKSDKI